MIRNLTPHAVTIFVEGRDPLVLPPDPAGPARCRASSRPIDPVDGIPAVMTTFGAVEDLPAPVDGVFLLVSGLVLDAVAGRSDTGPVQGGAAALVEAARAQMEARAPVGRTAADLCAPGDLVRGPDGQPVGCRGVRVRR